MSPPGELEREVLERNGRHQGDEIRFRCPHPDRHNNGDADPSARYNPTKGVWRCDVCGESGGWKSLAELLGVEGAQSGEIVARYAYTDEEGGVLFEVVRTAHPKDFFQRRPDGRGGWINNVKGVRRVLYRLPEVIGAVKEARTIYVVEGEKDADNLAKLGLVATTNPSGAGKWRKEYTETVSGATVAFLGDNDKAGEEHAEKVAQALHGVAAEVRVVELPDLPSEGDVSNWIEAMKGRGAGTVEIVAKLESLVRQAEVWVPSSAEEGVEERAGEAVQELWALGRDPEPATVRRALGRIAADLEGTNPLEIQTARELAIRALKGKVTAPAKFVDAALRGVPERQRPSLMADSGRGADPPYRATEQGLLHLKTTKEGEVPVLLTNFTAQIVAEVHRDDGAESQRWFEIMADHQGQKHRFEIASSAFPTMRWVGEQLGASAIVNAGMGTRDHVRAAIQHLSDRIESRRVFTHLGWRRIGEAWCYLHADGAIGPVGPVPGVETEPPSQLERFCLPEPVADEDPERAVRASLGILDVVPDEISLPTYCAVWRSVLGAADFGLHVAGQTGEGKTELVALAEQHFGAGLDARHLPGSWSSTGNSLEVLAFAAKDALLVVDDFAPEGTSFDVQRLHREAARLVRAQGNRAGRNRLRADGTLRSVKYPRGLLLSTGEDVPNAHSVRARILILELPQGGMDWQKLTTCQENATTGLYAQAMTVFLQWLAGRYEELQEHRAVRVRELRARAQSSSSAHRRTPSIVAELAFGLETFLAFARDVGVLGQEEVEKLWRRGWEALGKAAAAQAEHHGAVEPTGRFLELVGSALTSGRAHVASRSGEIPEEPHVWGWRRDGSEGPWHSQGERIGWVDGRDLYLDPPAAYRCAQQVATTDALSISARVLWKRMRDRGLLASTDTSRGRNLVRVTLQGARRKVVHLPAAAVIPSAKPAQSAQSAQEAGETGADGPFLWADSRDSGEEPAHKTGPGTAVGAPSLGVPGPIGPIGPVSDVQDPDWGEL